MTARPESYPAAGRDRKLVRTMAGRCAVLFPGPDAYTPGALSSLARSEPLVGELLSDVDHAAALARRPPVSPLLLDEDAPALDALATTAPAELHTAVFAAEFVLFQLLTGRHRLRPDVLLGHGFGDLVALTAAGILDLRQGMALVAARDDALAARPAAPGGMMALALSGARAMHLLAALGEWTVSVSAHDGPRQCVVSGPRTALDRVYTAAGALGVRAVRLCAPYAFHSRELGAAADEFAEYSGAAVRPRHGRHLVYSATLGRSLDGPEDTAALIAAHLVRPVRFADAVRALHAEGVDVFVECSPRSALTEHVTATVPGVTAIAPLHRRATAADVAAALASACDVPTGRRAEQQEAAPVVPRPRGPLGPVRLPPPRREPSVRTPAEPTAAGARRTRRARPGDVLAGAPPSDPDAAVIATGGVRGTTGGPGRSGVAPC
ncbi:acyltransferase domain-containing protein [Streptomyces sp. NPDC001941]|uniref:ACP S-malonyltransferase n=1 Tax=Streptomyces sp. NPDC001941 TaxID=3154659 RepID=UPI00332B266E